MDYSDTLSLLSSIYLCKPAREALENWKGLLSEDTPDYLLDMKNVVAGIDLSSEQELEDLLWEYTRLFVGPYKLPCPPWESVYTSSKRLMMQEAYATVKDLYREAGLTMNNSGIMYDHVGAELNFIAVLFKNIELKSRNCSYENIAKRFFNEHLMRWIPQFAQDMETASNSLLYKTVACATRNLIFEINNKFAVNEFTL